MTNERIMRLQEVLAVTGMKRSTLYHHVKAGKFPKPIKISERASGWLESEVNAWLDDKVQKSRG